MRLVYQDRDRHVLWFGVWEGGPQLMIGEMIVNDDAVYQCVMVMHAPEEHSVYYTVERVWRYEG